MKDLVLLVADKNTHFAVKGALERPEALGIRSIQFEFRVHPGRDGGMRKSGPELLSVEHRRFAQALLVMDFEGSGTEHSNGQLLEEELDKRLSKSWTNKAKAIVIEPEVDVWMWGSDNSLREIFGWQSQLRIREWLQNKGFQFGVVGKPVRPKETMELLVRECKLPRSSALYQEIAKKLSLQKCVDPAFIRLRNQLQQWFPVGPTQ